MQASQFIESIEKTKGLKIACLEEIAYRMKYIDSKKLKNLAKPFKNSGYGKYLLNIIK